MTYKLKTLKDLEGIHREGEIECFVKINDLRQEAIKWIKRNDDEMFKNGRQTGSSPEKHVWLTGANAWIKQFFNITEDDLK